MVDLHHHLLPGLDDGAPNLATSVEMARIAAGDGITHIVCTPHASGRFPFQPELASARLNELRSALASASIPLELAAGCDFHLSYDNIQDALASPRKYTVNGSSYLLVELPDFGLPPTLAETFYDLRLAGMTPILTHPERNPTLQKDSTRLEDWLRAGMLIQVTANSITGDMGKSAQRMAERLLQQRAVHFIATDAHNTTSRPPRMRAAREITAKRHGAEYAARLTHTNPLAVFQGHPLPQQHDAPYSSDENADEPAPPSLWRRMFGRR